MSNSNETAIDYIDDNLFFNDKLVMLIGFDIHYLIKDICDKCLTVGTNPNMTEDEVKAYKLAVDNVLSLLEQVLNHDIHQGSEEYHNIAVHVPNKKEMEEFLTIEDILKYLEQKENK